MENLLQQLLPFAALLASALLLFTTGGRRRRIRTAVWLSMYILTLLWQLPALKLGWLEYPLRPWPAFYDISLSLLPLAPAAALLCQRLSEGRGILWTGYWSLVISALLTAAEYLLDFYTPLVKYLEWNSLLTFAAAFLTLQAAALLGWILCRPDNSERYG